MSPQPALKTVGAGFAVAALAALAQLGLAYGFGLLSWAEDAPGAADAALEFRWSANRAWVAWFSAASCVVGGLASGAIGSRAARLGTATRVAAVLASAAGAFLVGPLVSLSAEQGAGFADFPTEPLTAAGAGAAVGFALALIGLSSRSVAANVGASVALVWLLAVLSVFWEVGDRVSPVTELAVWGSWAGPDTALGIRGLSTAVPFIVGSTVIGVVVALVARRGTITSSGYRIAAASGIAGPLIVTVAHLVAGPSRSDNAELISVIMVGPYAAIAGLLGSLIVCALPKSGAQIDDRAPDREAAPAGLVESAPGWTVPGPASAYDGDTAQLHGSPDAGDAPAAPEKPKRPSRREQRAAKQAAKHDEQKRAEWEPQEGDDAPNPDVDWVQELKAVDMGESAEPEPEAKPAPARRAKKTTARTRRKIAPDDDAADES